MRLFPLKIFNDLEKAVSVENLIDDPLTEFCWIIHNDIWGYSCHEDRLNNDCENYIYFHQKCLKDVPFNYNYNNKIYRLAALTFINAPDETHMSNNDRIPLRQEFLCIKCHKEVRKVILSQSCEMCADNDPDFNPDFLTEFNDVLRLNRFFPDEEERNPLLDVE